MIRRLLLPALVCAFTGAAPATFAPAASSHPAPGAAGPGMPRFLADGALLRPDSVERWVLVGTSLGLGYSNATDDGVGMFHRVYLEPGAYEHFLRTGRFRNGTMLALSIRHPVRRVPPSRAGWSEGDLVALELAVKDPERFRGGWAYFDFGREGRVARALPGERCARCHAEHAVRDNVFMQFYPQLRAH
jgi:hypothetical protein